MQPKPRTATTNDPKPLRLVLLAGLAAAFLTACGVIAAVAPPIDVGDPMDVDGTSVEAELVSGGLSTAALAHLGATKAFAFGDMEVDLRGFSIASFYTNVGLSDTVRVTGGGVESDYPTSIEVTGGRLSATVEDDVNGNVTFGVEADLSLTYERDSCSVDACSYVYAGDDPLDGVLDLRLTDSGDLATLVAIIREGDTPSPNRGELEIGIEVDSDPALAGFTATFTLTSDGSRIRLGG
ncbi:MAG: hypothetical protein WD336_10380 [Trueperaceae bacterium]